MNKKFDLQNYLTAELRRLQAPRRLEIFNGETYIGGGNSKLTYLNLSIPEVRLVLKKNLPLFSEALEKQFTAFEKVWKNSRIFEVRMIALYWLEGLTVEQLIQLAPRLTTWADKIDNWADSDTLCGIYARIFEATPKRLLKTYKTWNKHKNPWLRRCSMVALFYYSRSRKKQPSFKLAVSLVKPHLLATEHYVQKAVGWTTREMHNVYPIETTQFIADNLMKIHPIAWYAASEKMQLSLKKKLVEKRRNLRKLKK